VDRLLDDLEDAIAQVKKGGSEKQGDLVALYGTSCVLFSLDKLIEYTGMGQTNVGPHVFGKLAETFLDVLYE
jgi:sphinganine-1-phosphate aldolase